MNATMGLFCLKKLCLRNAGRTEVSRISDSEQHAASMTPDVLDVEAPLQKTMCECASGLLSDDRSPTLLGSPVKEESNEANTNHPVKMGSNGNSENVLAASGATIEEKKLRQLPAFESGEELFGAVFVHGSGDCDQLGLGADVLERKKPALVPGLCGISIRSIACGGMHTLCISSDGQLFSWGCGDDGALGRSSGNDCEPALVEMPEKTTALSAACGDSHSCCIDSEGKAWLWGSYKDSSGYIGITPPSVAKMQDGMKISEKRGEPASVCGLHDVVGLASGTNHTIALTSAGHVYTWGSNQTGQLGLQNGCGCEVFEEEICTADTKDISFLSAENGGVVALRSTNVKVGQVVRVHRQDGSKVDARTISLSRLQDLIAEGVRTVVLELTDRKVPLSEKQSLLFPHRISLEDNSRVAAVFASCECTFLTTKQGIAYGCGLNCHGQVGAGYISAGIWEMKQVIDVEHADWLGGGTHMSAALVNGKVFAWGRPEECGHGASARSTPVLRPCVVERLPRIRNLRCGMSHTLACSVAGDVFTWGCGVSHQLGNRPRDCHDPHDARDEPTDETVPYRLSSKLLEDRFVLLADGGAQHSVELVWTADVNQQSAMDTVEDEQSTGDQDIELKQNEDGSCVDAALVDPEVVKIETRYDFWRVQVESVYRRRNPYKLDNVPDLLKKYEGQEAILYTKVCLKYDLNPSKFYADPSSWEGEEGDVKPEDDGHDASGVTMDAGCTGVDPQTVFVFGQPDVDSGVPSFAVSCSSGPFHSCSTMNQGTSEEVSDDEDMDEDCSNKKVKRNKRSRSKASEEASEDSADAPSEKKKVKSKGKRIIKENHKFKKSKPHSKAG